MREPLSSLRRTDIFVLTKTNLNPDIIDLKYFLEQINPKAIIFSAEHKPIGFYEINQNNVLLDRNTLKGKTVTLISGIGDPDSFENLIVSMGINIGLSFRFPDHYNYTQEDLAKISAASREKNIDTIVTTEKDAARLLTLHITHYTLHILKSAYPQGGEKQLIKAILKREVPSGKLPFDIGVVVQNVATINAIYEVVYLGKPLYERVVTVAGDCLENPGNFLVRIGTPVKDLIAKCGPLKKEPRKILFGGPMMGIV